MPCRSCATPRRRTRAGSGGRPARCRLASCAVRIMPVPASSSALLKPTNSTSRSAPPHAGMISRATWLNPILMSSAASRMSAATATSAPPPSACPFSAAMVGPVKPAMRSQIERIRHAIAPPRVSVRSALSSLRSPPDTNARSPAPVMTSAAAPSRPVERLVELVHRLQRDGVAGVRAVDGDDRQAVNQLQVHHRAFSVCGIGILSSGE